MLTVKRKSSKLLCMLADIAVDLLRPKEMEKKNNNNNNRDKIQRAPFLHQLSVHWILPNPTVSFVHVPRN